MSCQMGTKFDNICSNINSFILSGPYCGDQSEVPEVIVSAGRTLTIIFRTDASSQREGFYLTYRYIA